VVISDSDSTESEYDTGIENSITDNLVGGGRNDWTTDGILSHSGIKVIPKDTENVEEITNVIIGDDFCDT
jgi:hypothetical protein